MAKRRSKKNGTCAYCLATGVRVEREHVFPASWHPDGVPPERMITVPACRRCNGDFGRVEDRLFFPLTCGLPLNSPASRGLFDRAMRSIDSGQANGFRDAAYRDARLRSILNRLRVLTSDFDPAAWSPTERYRTEVMTPGGLLVRGTPAVNFNPDEMAALGVKLVRGFYFHIRGVPLPAKTPVSAQLFSVDPSVALEASSKIAWNHGGLPPVYEFRWARAAEDATVTLWLFNLWNHYVLYGASGNGVENEMPASNAASAH